MVPRITGIVPNVYQYVEGFLLEREREERGVASWKSRPGLMIKVYLGQAPRSTLANSTPPQDLVMIVSWNTLLSLSYSFWSFLSLIASVLLLHLGFSNIMQFILRFCLLNFPLSLRKKWYRLEPTWHLISHTRGICGTYHPAWSTKPAASS